MTKFVRMGLLVSAAILLAAASIWPQARPFASPQDVQKIYDRLLPQVDGIPIYDNHSHATFPDDSDMDARKPLRLMKAPSCASATRIPNSSPPPKFCLAIPTTISSPSMPHG